MKARTSVLKVTTGYRLHRSINSSRRSIYGLFNDNCKTSELTNLKLEMKVVKIRIIYHFHRKPRINCLTHLCAIDHSKISRCWEQTLSNSTATKMFSISTQKSVQQTITSTILLVALFDCRRSCQRKYYDQNEEWSSVGCLIGITMIKRAMPKRWKAMFTAYIFFKTHHLWCRFGEGDRGSLAPPCGK